MGKKESELSLDFQFGILEIIPSKQRSDNETEDIKKFKAATAKELSRQSAKLTQFPTTNEVFIYIQQFFASRNEYEKRDVDNMAKTMLDLLTENGFLKDDSQVRTLLISKKCDKTISQNFAYLAIKELKSEQDISLVRIAGFQRAKELYLGIKKNPSL